MKNHPISLLIFLYFSIFHLFLSANAEGLSLYLCQSGSDRYLNDTIPDTGPRYEYKANNTTVTVTFNDYFLEEDITGTDYTFAIICASTSTRTFSVEIKIGGESVASTSFSVSGETYMLYTTSIVGIDPVITGTEEVELLVTINGSGGATSGILYGNTGSPHSHIVIPPLVSSGIHEYCGIPKEYVLMQNYPNPFNPKTVISYHLPVISNVELTVYNALGKKVHTLVKERQPAGAYSVTFDSMQLPSGLYFYRINAGSYQEVKKMIVIQ